MRYGVSFLPDATETTKSPQNYFADILAVSRHAEKLGFDYVKMTEHYLHGYGGYCPNPLMFLSAVAAQTSRIRLMTGGIMAAFHHPVQIATHTAMLDAMSGGRLDVGFARAWLPHEFEMFEVSLDDSRERFVDTVTAVRRLWTEADVKVDSSFFRFTVANGMPACVQRPHPPVWVAAVQSRQSFAWIAEQGFNLLITPGVRGYESLRDLVGVYRETFADVHGDRSAPRVALSLPLVLRNTHSEAVDLADQHLQRYLDVWSDAAKAWDTTTSVDYPRYTGFGHALKIDSPEAMRTRLAAVAGSPETALGQIELIREQVDPDVFLWQVDTGVQSAATAISTLDLFAAEVMPRIGPAGALREPAR